MNKKYINFGVGWLKNTQKGDEYISATSKGKNQKGKLMYEDENGDSYEVSSFAVFFNNNKKKADHPDVQFTFSVDE